MKRFVFIILILWGCSLGSHAQRSNIIGAFQLIENGKYEDAKKAIQEAVVDKKTRKWSKTYYARGLLCQTAYEKGIAKKDKKLYELYPDQLIVAYDSYKKALTLRKNDRILDQLEPLFVELANDFIKVSEQHYTSKRYEDALKTFEYVMEINQSKVLSLELDTSLIYNTALAAYKGKLYDKAIKHLNRLNELNYSTNVPHLLYAIHIEQGDTASAKEALIDGIDRYEKTEDLILLLVDINYEEGNIEEAVEVLDTAALKTPSNYIFPFTKGLLYQKVEQYDKAIEAYKQANVLDSAQIESCTKLGTCYFNIGVEIEKYSRSIKNNSVFLTEKAKSTEARKSAVKWLEKAYEYDPENQTVREQLSQLYQVLQESEKLEKLD